MLDRPAFKSDTSSEARWIITDLKAAREKFDRHSFEVSHRLASHPLFQLPKLLELAERTAKSRPDDLYFDMGEIRPGQRWDQIPEARFSAVEAMQQLESSDAWFIFRHTQRDPEYNELFDRGLGEIKEIAGDDVDSLIRQQDIIIFVTSPKRVTPYHMDRECNFLLQITSSTVMIEIYFRMKKSSASGLSTIMLPSLGQNISAVPRPTEWCREPAFTSPSTFRIGCRTMIIFRYLSA